MGATSTAMWVPASHTCTARTCHLQVTTGHVCDACTHMAVPAPVSVVSPTGAVSRDRNGESHVGACLTHVPWSAMSAATGRFCSRQVSLPSLGAFSAAANMHILHGSTRPNSCPLHAATPCLWRPAAVCSYFLSLSLAPSAVVGLDAKLRAPKVELLCSARPSLFAYPPPVTQEASKEVRNGRVPALCAKTRLPHSFRIPTTCSH